MSVTALVQVLQIVSGVAWLLPATIMAPGILRVWRGRGDPIDAMRGPVFFIALVQIGFTVRWLIWPHAIPAMGGTELSTWAGLYVLSTMCAIGVTIANRFAESLR